MLKACCDCVAAGFREENDAYGTQLNENNLKRSKTENGMFSLPKELNPGDKIIVTSVIANDPQQIFLSLIKEDSETKNPDFTNIAAEMEINFFNDIFKFKTVTEEETLEYFDPNKPNHPKDIITNYYVPGTSFSIKIDINKNEDIREMAFEVGSSFIKKIILQHKLADIKYIRLDGDVEKVSKLEFLYA